MKKTNILLLLLLCFFINKLKAQYAIGGIQGNIYVDIVPDTLLNPPFTENNYHDYYYIDINQDGVNDIKFDAISNYSPGDEDKYIACYATNSATLFSFWKIDSVPNSAPCTGWNNSGILKPYNSGDTIKNSTYVSADYLTSYNRYTNCSATFADSHEWIDSTDHYVGIKYSTATDTLYGWVRVNVTNYSKILIKDFSLGAPLMGINTYTKNNTTINIYPNPATNKINVEAKEVLEIKLLDVVGRQILSTTQNQIDISTLPNGVYFVQVKNTSGSGTQKIIVQH